MIFLWCEIAKAAVQSNRSPLHDCRLAMMLNGKTYQAAKKLPISSLYRQIRLFRQDTRCDHGRFRFPELLCRIARIARGVIRRVHSHSDYKKDSIMEPTSLLMIVFYDLLLNTFCRNMLLNLTLHLVFDKMVFLLSIWATSMEISNVASYNNRIKHCGLYYHNIIFS